jgi:hypothetical protein
MEDKEPKEPARYENDPSTLDSALGFKPVTEPVHKYSAKFVIGKEETKLGPFATFEELAAAAKSSNVTCIPEPYFKQAGEVRTDDANNVVVGTWNKT